MQHLPGLVQGDRIVADFAADSGELLELLRVVLAHRNVPAEALVDLRLDAVPQRAEVGMDDLDVLLRLDEIQIVQIETVAEDRLPALDLLAVPLPDPDVLCDPLKLLRVSGFVKQRQISVRVLPRDLIEEGLHAADPEDVAVVEDGFVHSDVKSSLFQVDQRAGPGVVVVIGHDVRELLRMRQPVQLHAEALVLGPADLVAAFLAEELPADEPQAQTRVVELVLFGQGRHAAGVGPPSDEDDVGAVQLLQDFLDLPGIPVVVAVQACDVLAGGHLQQGVPAGAGAAVVWLLAEVDRAVRVLFHVSADRCGRPVGGGVVAHQDLDVLPVRDAVQRPDDQLLLVPHRDQHRHFDVLHMRCFLLTVVLRFCLAESAWKPSRTFTRSRASFSCFRQKSHAWRFSQQHPGVRSGHAFPHGFLMRRDPRPGPRPPDRRDAWPAAPGSPASAPAWKRRRGSRARPTAAPRTA